MAGKFIVFEGGEGCGKTTQAKMLASALVALGLPVLLTKEPGGDEGVCADIKKILLNEKYARGFSREAEALLFEADRAQHVEQVIKPALASGKIVLCDRYEAATFAYQAHARAVFDDFGQFMCLNGFATRGLVPDFIFWIDIDPKIGLERNLSIGKRDRFEMENLAFHEKVREGYTAYFKEFVPYYENKLNRKIEHQKLDGGLSITELHHQVLDTLKEKRLI
jgi:dTMP kinase